MTHRNRAGVQLTGGCRQKPLPLVYWYLHCFLFKCSKTTNHPNVHMKPCALL